MSESRLTRVSADTLRELAAAAGVRPDESAIASLAGMLGAMLATIERCEELNLAEHEPCTALHLSGGAADAEL